MRESKKVTGNRFSFYFYPMPWKINDKGKAIEDIYIMDVSTAKPNKKVLTKDQTYKVKDVISYKCMQFLDVSVQEQINMAVAYDCPQCKTHHLAKKKGGRYIDFPFHQIKIGYKVLVCTPGFKLIIEEQIVLFVCVIPKHQGV